jgi:S1-C subfamily serine protease
MVRVLSLAICFIAISASTSIGREWTDAGGKRHIEASLVEVGKDSVRLKKPDGKIITLRLDQLSQADRDFLTVETAKVVKDADLSDKPDAGGAGGSVAPPASLSAGAKTFKDLESLAKKQPTAATVVTLYKLFLDDVRIEKAEKTLAKERLAHWQDLETNGAMRLGGKWVTSKQLAQWRTEEQRLVDEAYRLIEIGNGQLAEDKLTAASKANPDGTTADFLLGLNCSLVKRTPITAEQHFTECVKRLRRKGSLSTEDRANLIAALNNLAIVEVRQKKQATALKHWKEASQLAPPPAEVIQNVGRFAHLARAAPKLGIPKTTEKTAGDLFAKLALRSEKQRFENNVGWLYIGSFGPSNTQNKENPASRSRKPGPHNNPMSAGGAITVGFGSGFVIHPGYVVTNHHVAGDADEIIIHTRTNQVERHKARLIATSPKEDIALLECKDKELMALPAVAFSLAPPRLASDLLVLGYPEPELIGTDLKATRGSVTGLPNPNVGNLLIYDATTNGGNSGGPVADQRGQAIAVHSTGYLLTGKLAGGVPAAVVLAFIKKELPGFEQPSASQTAIEWSEVAETVGQSTVQIEILKVPTSPRAIASTVPVGTTTQSAWRSFEDPWCMLCNGTGHIDCSRCARGAVLVTTSAAAGRNPLTGEPLVNSVETEVRCTVCSGSGRVPCKYCVDGIDPTVQGARGQ